MPWLVVVTIGLLAGDLLARISLPVWLHALTALGGGVVVICRMRCGGLAPRLGAALIALAFGYGNADRIYRPILPPQHLANLPLPMSLRVAGRLAADIERRGEQTRMLIVVERFEGRSGWQEASGLVSLSLRQAKQEWQAGDRVEAILPLRRPRNFGNPGEFDYPAHLARQSIYLTSFSYDDATFVRMAGPPSWRRWMSRWRGQTREVYRQALPRPEAELLDALVLGSQRELPYEVQDSFRRTGTSHILAISGLNVGLVAAAGFALFRWLLSRSRRLLLERNVPRLATIFSLLPVVLYAGIAGTNLSTVRALAMAFVLLGAIIAERPSRSIVSLAAAAALVLLLWPGSGSDPSFQLSFAAVAGLVLGMEHVHRWRQRRSKARMLPLRGWRGRTEDGAMLYAAVTAVAMATTVPLVAYHFNQLSLIAPLANAVAVPLLGSVAVGFGLLAALATPFSPMVAKLCAIAAWPALSAGTEVVRWLSELSLAAVRIVSVSTLELTLTYGLLASPLIPTRWRRSLIAAVSLVAAVDIGWSWHQRYHQSDLQVTFLSVGQGDCAVVQLPGGEVMVIDGGGLSSRSFDVGERIIAPFLWSRKIARIDYLVLSHPQWDHYGGMTFLAEQFQPREFWWTGRESDGPSFQALLGTIRRMGVEMQTLRGGMTRRLGSVEAFVLGPDRSDGVSLNDSSLVLALRYGGRQLTFTGDIEQHAEQELLRLHGAELVSAVLKVPHHGSATSSSVSFLSQVAPELAVISAGFANHFGLPNAAVVRRYAARGGTTHRTDVEGAVEVRCSATGEITSSTYGPVI